MDDGVLRPVDHASIATQRFACASMFSCDPFFSSVFEAFISSLCTNNQLSSLNNQWSLRTSAS